MSGRAIAIGAAGAIIALAAAVYTGYLLGSRPIGAIVRGHEYRLDSIQSVHRYALDSLEHEIRVAQGVIVQQDSILAIPKEVRHESNLRITRSLSARAQLDSLLAD